jgi:hypothetical protein
MAALADRSQVEVPIVTGWTIRQRARPCLDLSHWRAGTARRAAFKRSAFQVTPIVADGKLPFCTPFDRVVRWMLDPASGAELWVSDRELSLESKPANDFKCRGDSHLTVGRCV